jgi:Iron-binding zinc finger CDGSH type
MPATKITINSNGNIRVEGDFEIVDPQGQAFGLAGRTAIGLCRCGHSKNKPFCDGSHNASMTPQWRAICLLQSRKSNPIRCSEMGETVSG